MVNEKVLRLFMLPDARYELSPYGCGHINATYLVTGGEKRYVLQKINDSVFTDVDGLMRNVGAVCEFNIRKTAESGGDVEKCLNPVKTVDGNNYAVSEGGYYRVYNFIERTVSLDMPLSAEHFGEGGACFAGFAKNLASFDASTLCDVIPGFHDTSKRVEKLIGSIEKDEKNRAAEMKSLIEFAIDRAPAAPVVTDGINDGLIPLRVTHNDTKFNNLLFDEVTKKPVSVIDLDTVMKGSLLYDFGDAVRTGCNAAAEDEHDLDKVVVRKDYFDAVENAYLSVMGDELKPEEKRLLGFSAMLMTYECGVRFLTDYLEGDVYFRTHYDRQNVFRARTQFKLVAEMEKEFGKMTDFIGR